MCALAIIIYLRRRLSARNRKQTTYRNTSHWTRCRMISPLVIEIHHRFNGCTQSVLNDWPQTTNHHGMCYKYNGKWILIVDWYEGRFQMIMQRPEKSVPYHSCLESRMCVIFWPKELDHIGIYITLPPLCAPPCAPCVLCVPRMWTIYHQIKYQRETRTLGEGIHFREKT